MKALLPKCWIWILPVTVGVHLSACKQQPSQQSEQVPPEAPRTVLVITEELRAKLAEADAADGQADHIVSKCVPCNLIMKGRPAYATTVADYTLQLCTADCKSLFEKDPAKTLLALKSSE